MLNKSDVKKLPNILGQLLLLTIVIFGCFALNKQVHATIVQQPLEATQKRNINQTVGYTITNEPSILQISDKKVSYYYLATRQKQEFTVYIDILNGAHKNTFDISVNTGVTNRNLSVDYGTPLSQSTGVAVVAPFEFEKIVGVDTTKYGVEKNSRTTLTVPADTRARIPVTIHMPRKHYNGIMSGGISVLKENQQVNAKSTLQNQYAYVKGLVLQQGTADIQPQLDYGSLKTIAKDYQPKTIVTINNSTLVNIEHVSMSGTITNKLNQVISKVNVQDGEISPAAKIPVEFVWSKKNFKNGHYKMHLQLNDQNNHRWAFTRDFTVTNRQKILKAAQYHAPINRLLVLLVSVIVLLIAICVWLLVKNHQKKD